MEQIEIAIHTDVLRAVFIYLFSFVLEELMSENRG